MPYDRWFRKRCKALSWKEITGNGVGLFYEKTWRVGSLHSAAKNAVLLDGQTIRFSFDKQNLQWNSKWKHQLSFDQGAVFKTIAKQQVAVMRSCVMNRRWTLPSDLCDEIAEFVLEEPWHEEDVLASEEDDFD